MFKSIALTVLKYLAIYAVVGIIGISFMLWRAYRQRQLQRLAAEGTGEMAGGQFDPLALSTPRLSHMPETTLLA